MSNFVISLLASIGAATWVYTKIMRQTGGNQQSSLTVAGIAGVFAFIVFTMILNALSTV